MLLSILNTSYTDLEASIVLITKLETIGFVLNKACLSS